MSDDENSSPQNPAPTPDPLSDQEMQEFLDQLAKELPESFLTKLKTLGTMRAGHGATVLDATDHDVFMAGEAMVGHAVLCSGTEHEEMATVVGFEVIDTERCTPEQLAAAQVSHDAGSLPKKKIHILLGRSTLERELLQLMLQKVFCRPLYNQIVDLINAHDCSGR